MIVSCDAAEKVIWRSNQELLVFILYFYRCEIEQSDTIQQRDENYEIELRMW